MTYYKVKTARDILPTYADYVKLQTAMSYVSGEESAPKPKAKSVKLEVHKSPPEPRKEAVDNNTLFIQQKFSNLDRNIKILDCACGGGAQMGTLSKMGFKHVAGLELGARWLKTAKKTDVVYGVVKEDMHWLGFRADAFDCVFSAHTLEHAYYPAKVIQEFWRVIKPDGRLFMLLPYPDGGMPSRDNFHCAKGELGLNILDNGKALTNFFEENGFRLTIKENSAGLVNEPIIWLQFRKRLYNRGKPYKPWE